MKTRKLSRPNRLVAAVMAFVLALYTCAVPVSIAGADNGEAANTTSSNYELAKTATNLDSNYESDIQLSVKPKSEESSTDEGMDILFVLDYSKSIENNRSGYLEALKKWHQDMLPYENVNVGVVIFANIAETALSLRAVDIDDGFEAKMEELLDPSKGKKETAFSKFNSNYKGTNIQSGLRQAHKVLSGDNSIKNNTNKKIVLLTDGGAYWYYGKKGLDENVVPINPVSFVQNDWELRTVQNEDSGDYNVVGDKVEKSKYNQQYSTFADFMAGEGDSIVNSMSGMHTKQEVSDWVETKDYNAEIARDAYRTLRSDSLGDSYKSLLSFADYPYINMERGTYFAALDMLELQELGYSIFTLGTTYKPDAGVVAQKDVANAFTAWTENVGTYRDCTVYDENHKPVTSNWVDFNLVENALGEVANSSSSTTTLKAGSQIVDKMGYGSDDGHGNAYDFDFVDDAGALTVSVKTEEGTQSYSATKVEGTFDDGETSRYTFGNDSDTPLFTLHYYANEPTSNPRADYFTLDINRDIEPGEELLVNYKVKLANPQAAEGTYGTYDETGKDNTANADVPLETNHVATLQPKDGDSENFPEPTVSYTVEPSTLTLTGKKVWNDAGNQDGMRPSTVAITVAGSDGQVYPVAVSGSGNEWSYSVSGLPKKNERGEDIIYTVDEPSVPSGYTKSVSGTDITNTHTPAVVSVSGTKTWDDNDNQDGVRPTSITVNLLGNGTRLQSRTVTAADGWSYSFTDLPKYAGGAEVAYTVTENAVADYTSTISGYNITNTHAPGKTSVSVAKAWSDSGNADGARPESVSVQLLADGVAKGSPVTLNATDNWAYTWSDLPEKAAGKAIAYTVEETAVPKGYTPTVSGDAKTGFTITNAHAPEMVSVSGTKTWADDDDADGKRPSSITVRLKNGGKLVATQTVSPDSSGAWKYTFEDLPKYENGSAISYSIEEDTVPGYKASYNGYDITNTYDPETISVRGVKVWNDDGDVDDMRPKSITVNLYANGEKIDSGTVSGKGNVWAFRFTNLPKNAGGKKVRYTVDEDVVAGYKSKVDGFKITNTRKTEKVNISGEKVWDDGDDQDGIRPKNVTVNLLADGKVVDSTTASGAGNTWHFSFEGLPRAKDGKEITYSVEEEAVSGYTARYSGDVDKGFTVTNEHAPEQIAVSGKKTWNDDGDRDGERPSSITVRLRANGVEVDSKTVTAADGWAYTFEGLPKKADGKDISYTVTEDAVPGYSTTMNGYDLTNAHTPGLVSVTVSKAWDDGADRDSLRPDSVQVQLSANGAACGSPVTLSSANNWTYTWHALYANSAGVPIDYTVAEVSVPDGYTATVSGSATHGYTITNTHAPATVAVPVSKVWDDDGDDVGVRPDSVTMRLFVNGLETDRTLELSAANGWSGAFTGLSKYVDGVEAAYTVEEAAVDGYESTVTGDAATGFTVTNQLEIFDFDEEDTPLASGEEDADDDDADKSSDGDDSVDIDDDGTPTTSSDGDDADGGNGGTVNTGDEGPIGPLSALLLLALACGSGTLVARRLPAGKR